MSWVRNNQSLHGEKGGEKNSGPPACPEKGAKLGGAGGETENLSDANGDQGGEVGEGTSNFYFLGSKVHYLEKIKIRH